jgi:hypothetical protein
LFFCLHNLCQVMILYCIVHILSLVEVINGAAILWLQEAFKAVEDLHGLIMLTKKPSLLANYYQKLALVFWNSDNQLFHACSYLRLFHLTREQRKNLSSEDLQKWVQVCNVLDIKKFLL